MKKQKRKMKVCQQGREDGNLGISFTQHLMMISKAEKSYIIRHLLLSLSSGKSVYGRAGETYGTGPPGRAPNLRHFSSVRPDGYRDSPDRAGTKTEQHPILKANVTAPLEVTTTKGKICKTTDQPIENNKHRIQPIKNKMQIFTNIKFKKIMKKQILILALFALAILSSTNESFGQNLTAASNLAPQSLPASCSADALHPRAGIPYEYRTLIGNSTDLATQPTGYTWWATQNPIFLDATHLTGDQTGALTTTGAGELLATDLKYNDPTGAPTMKITWSPEILSKTLYHATATDAPKKSTFVAVLANGSCSNNLQVFEIDPKPAFTVDITNIDITNATTKTRPYLENVSQCVDKVQSASYSGGNVTMNYGKNTLYFEVISANFVTSWLPTFQIKANSLKGTAPQAQTADISWFSTLADAQSGTATPIETFPAQVDGAVIQGIVPLVAAAGANTAAGVSIFVKVVINNNGWESIAPNNFTLIVDGMDKTNQWDLNNATAAATCDVTGKDFVDESAQTITARPQINDDTANPGVLAPSFVPKN